MARFNAVWVVLLWFSFACQQGGSPAQTQKAAADQTTDFQAKAQTLADQYLMVDTHIDVPYRLQNKPEDISQRTPDGDFDYVRAKAGGLNAAFMSIYTPADLQGTGKSKPLADDLIDMVEGFAVQWPEKYAIAKSVADLEAQFGTGVISLPMGMENGAPIEGDLANLEHFYNRGIRYITLTHGKANHICDSSYDTERPWSGLSPFGVEVVREMNRLGIMVDISHVSDDTFYQVMEHSTAPVIASHSSCREFVPGFERNMSDDMIRMLAKKGGVMMINFGSSFISGKVNESGAEAREHLREHYAAMGWEREDPEAQAYRNAYMKEHVGYASLADVVAHFTHVIDLVGVDYVGFGSDYDGVGDSLPTGLKDVSAYPNLIAELLKHGLTDKDIEKVCGGNLLRVWRAVEKEAMRLQDETLEMEE